MIDRLVVSHDNQIVHQRDSPGDIANMEYYHDEATETQCIKHILEFYIGNGEGVATARSILEYSIQLV